MKLPLEKKKRKKKRKAKRWTNQRIRRCWINACLDLWSILIRHRDKKCIWCGSTTNLHAHHIVSKALLGGNLAGYFNMCNGMTLCFKCHMHRLKADVDAYIMVRDCFLGRIGVSYMELRGKYDLSTKFTKDDLSIVFQYELKPMVLEINCEAVEKIERKYLSRIPQ